MAVPPILGSSYLRKLSKNIGGKLKRLSRPLISGGIGDKMDKGNLWIVPGFTILIFACLWTTKLSKVALEESTCRGASIYDFTGTQLDQDAQRHCQTARRYYVAPEEPLLYDYKWKLDRQVKNPEWILWFWAPIVFIMYVITRFIWSLLLDNQGINFPNIVNAAESVQIENDGIIEIDEEKLNDRLNIIAENFRCSTSSRAFSAFIAFEFSLVLAPICLLIFVLPIMIGPNYRSWGLDVIKAWWERKDWQGVSLQPVFGFHSSHELSERPSVPLIPRITYCDYQFVSIGNSHTLTYRCYLDANWHERTALFIWIMLVFLTIVNFLNLFFWIEWAIRMKFKKSRRKWVLRKWLNTDEFLTDNELILMKKFASSFKTGNLLLFYYIEAHSSRVVASAFCIALFRRWLDKRAIHFTNNPINNNNNDNNYNGGQKSKEPIGWKLDPEEGDNLAPSPSEYYSPIETGESPETTMPFISPQHQQHHHRYTDSSDSSNSKQPREKSSKFSTSTPFAPGETPRGIGTGRPQFPRRGGGGGHYSKNLREASREKPKMKIPLMSSKERRKLEKENKDKDKKKKDNQQLLEQQEDNNINNNNGERRRFGCAVI